MKTAFIYLLGISVFLISCSQKAEIENLSTVEAALSAVQPKELEEEIDRSYTRFQGNKFTNKQTGEQISNYVTDYFENIRIYQVLAVKGLKDGLEVEWNLNGKIRAIRNFKKGKQIGRAYLQAPDYKVAETWKKGIIQDRTTYKGEYTMTGIAEEGIFKEVDMFKNGEKVCHMKMSEETIKERKYNSYLLRGVLAKTYFYPYLPYFERWEGYEKELLHMNTGIGYADIDAHFLPRIAKEKNRENGKIVEYEVPHMSLVSYDKIDNFVRCTPNGEAKPRQPIWDEKIALLNETRKKVGLPLIDG